MDVAKSERNHRVIAGVDDSESVDAPATHIQNDRPTLRSQVERVRQDIQEHGESIVGCEELRVLCPDEVPVSTQWSAIARIAKGEGWSFTYFPNGNVGFANL